MICSYCGEVIEPGQKYYSFDDADVCEDCLEEYLSEYAEEHIVTCTEEEEPIPDKMESWAEWRCEK